MAKLFKCDFCGAEVEHEHQLSKAERTGFENHPRFSDLYPELVDHDICSPCGQAAQVAEGECREELLALMRIKLKSRDAR